MDELKRKVLAGLEFCAQGCTAQCAKCPYHLYKGGEVPNSLDDCFIMTDIVWLLRRNYAVWQYYTNDEGRARWKCSACGKICRRDPRDKKFCSACGSPMRMEA